MACWSEQANELSPATVRPFSSRERSTQDILFSKNGCQAELFDESTGLSGDFIDPLRADQPSATTYHREAGFIHDDNNNWVQ